MGEWISVKDDLPEIGRRVLLLTSDNRKTIGILTPFGFHSNELGFNEDELPVTHWMALPK